MDPAVSKELPKAAEMPSQWWNQRNDLLRAARYCQQHWQTIGFLGEDQQDPLRPPFSDLYGNFQRPLPAEEDMLV
jgi:hypothetical protein